MSKVLYYLGAGASAKSIKPDFGITDTMEKHYQKYQKAFNPNEQFDDQYGIHHLRKALLNSRDRSSSSVSADDLQYLIDEIDRIIIILSEYPSIDTFYRIERIFYDHAESMEGLVRTLKVLGFILNVLHFYNGIDSRYYNLIASLLDDSGKLTPRARILTWNYDLQLMDIILSLEKRRVALLNDDIVEDDPIENRLSPDEALIVHGFSFKGRSLNSDNIRIHHLNGLAMNLSLNNEIQYSYGFKSAMNIAEPFTKNIGRIIEDFGFIINDLVNSLKGGLKHSNSCISFAWLDSNHVNLEVVNRISSDLELLARDYDTLVVIGYSFPFFNRNIDSAILSKKMFKKVIIQDLYEDTCSEIEQELKAINRSIVDPTIANQAVGGFKYVFGDRRYFHIPSGFKA